MIDISDKDITKRVAKAEGFIELSEEALDIIVNNVNKKGDVLTVAQIAVAWSKTNINISL